ncbi:MAG: NADH:ubiquinone reductase (Na(+)-transporting) subunit C [Bacteroidales bacterium]
MNRQSNAYTVIYATIMVIVVAAVLAFTALSLKEKQAENVAVDKQVQILKSANVVADAKNAAELYSKYITKSFVINSKGEVLSGEAFSVNVEEEVKKADEERSLPVYVANIDGATKYILPVRGAGLWGPIWGYVALEEDKNTIFGAFFSHKGETPGLGAEIEKDFFTNQFKGKHLFIDGEFKSVAVEKVGQVALDGAEQVDAISGGTITSKGVDAMLKGSLKPYSAFLTNK